MGCFTRKLDSIKRDQGEALVEGQLKDLLKSAPP